MQKPTSHKPFPAVQIQAKTKQLQAVRTLQEPLAALPEASKTLSDLAADITAEVQHTPPCNANSKP